MDNGTSLKKMDRPIRGEVAPNIQVAQTNFIQASVTMVAVKQARADVHTERADGAGAYIKTILLQTPFQDIAFIS